MSSGMFVASVQTTEGISRRILVGRDRLCAVGWRICGGQEGAQKKAREKSGEQGETSHGFATVRHSVRKFGLYMLEL